MEPITAIKLASKVVLSIPGVKEYIKRLPDPNTPTFLAARDEMFREWTVEHANLIEENYRYFEARVDKLEELVAQRADDNEAKAVYANYASQAYREPIDERRIMLAHATAGIIDVRLTVAEHARVQRRLDELEPDDVVTLWAVANTCGRVLDKSQYRDDMELRYAFWQQQPNAEALQAAGCVRALASGGGLGSGASNGLLVTGFGRLVLRVLRSYLRTRRSRVVVPGREVLDGSRSEQEAWAIIPASLRSMLIPLVARPNSGARYDVPKWSHDPNGGGLVPPPANGAAWLQVENLTDDEARALHAIAPYDPRKDEVMHGRPRETLGLEILQHDHRGAYVRLHGPHDALRWLADELDVLWT